MDNLIVYNSPFEKMRIGSNADGGYVTAKLPDGYDLFISGGIANNVDFEEHFLRIHPNIRGYGFDGTINNLPKPVKNFTFIKKNLGNANNNNLTNNVIFHGHVENVWSIFNQNTVLLFPSQWEGFPSALVECLICNGSVITNLYDYGIFEILPNSKSNDNNIFYAEAGVEYKYVLPDYLNLVLDNIQSQIS